MGVREAQELFIRAHGNLVREMALEAEQARSAMAQADEELLQLGRLLECKTKEHADYELEMFRRVQVAAKIHEEFVLQISQKMELKRREKENRAQYLQSLLQSSLVHVVHPAQTGNRPPPNAAAAPPQPPSIAAGNRPPPNAAAAAPQPPSIAAGNRQPPTAASAATQLPSIAAGNRPPPTAAAAAAPQPPTAGEAAGRRDGEHPGTSLLPPALAASEAGDGAAISHPVQQQASVPPAGSLPAPAPTALVGEAGNGSHTIENIAEANGSDAPGVPTQHVQKTEDLELKELICEERGDNIPAAAPTPAAAAAGEAPVAAVAAPAAVPSAAKKGRLPRKPSKNNRSMAVLAGPDPDSPGVKKRRLMADLLAEKEAAILQAKLDEGSLRVEKLGPPGCGRRYLFRKKQDASNSKNPVVVIL